MKLNPKPISLKLFVLFVCLFTASVGYTQTQPDMQTALTNIFAATEAAKALKLKKQNDALKKIKETLESLKNGGSAQEALSGSVEAFESYPRFSTPYLLAAYASLQLNNPLNAHRFLSLYDKMAKRNENQELNKEIPASFVNQLRSQTNASFSKYSAADINALSKKEGWLDHSLDLEYNIAIRALFVGDNDFFPTGQSNSDIDFENHITLAFSKFFWFNKGSALSTMSVNNYGLDLHAGIDYKFDISNPAYYPSRQQLFVSAGVFLQRWYIVPLKIQVNNLNTYSSSIGSFAYTYNNGTKTSNDYYRPIKYDGAPLIMPFTEVRYYTKLVSNYAHDFVRNKKPLTSSQDASYIYIKWNAENYEGQKTSSGEAYSGQQVEGLFGAMFGAGRLSIGMNMGVGMIKANNFKTVGKNINETTNIDDSFFKAGLQFKYRIL